MSGLPEAVETTSILMLLVEPPTMDQLLAWTELVAHGTEWRPAVARQLGLHPRPAEYVLAAITWKRETWVEIEVPPTATDSEFIELAGSVLFRAGAFAA